jgi:Protein of unknown function (DUF1566)
MRYRVVFVMIAIILGFYGLAFAADLYDNSDGTVTDYETGLVWQQGEGGTKTWESAISYCEGLSLAGKNDWRLPNRKELQFLVYYEKYSPALDTAFFPNASSSYYWSSTTEADTTTVAWLVDFNLGGAGLTSKANSYYVRCVRGGQ